jgi:pyruvate formate lyase activating enzyme
MGNNDFDKSKRDFLKRILTLSAGVVCIKSPLLSDSFISEGQNNKVLAMFQEETPRGIMCRICPNECILKEGELSECHNRRVLNSKLYTLAFGNPCSVNIDPVEKKPLYHFFPGSRAFSIATAGVTYHV